jgi:hypothetical protein
MQAATTVEVGATAVLWNLLSFAISRSHAKSAWKQTEMCKPRRRAGSDISVSVILCDFLDICGFFFFSFVADGSE